ncbi:MAG TPA: hypothetical protein VFV00_18295 [Acidimicrobiales bacterium]|nr:hypothetical protein [Acidimicrobiales bacterium]
MRIPRPLRRALRTRKRKLERWTRIRRGEAVSRLRVAAWMKQPWWLRLFPASTRHRMRLDAPAAGDRRVEIGAGFSGRPGYIHVDLLPFTDDIDIVASGDDLPIPERWADEILTVHMIEHVPPPRLMATLQHWYSRLRPGASLVLHTPNGAALGQAMATAGNETGDDERYWAVMSAVYGYGHHPADMTSPAALEGAADHKLVFTSPLLRRLLTDAGFVDVEDVSGQDAFCHHTRDWSPYVDGLCLEVRARRPA